MNDLEKYFPLSEEERDSLWAQYGKNKSDVKEDILILRDWLKKQPHIPEIKDDSFLENILIRNKCRMEKTKTKIDNYFTGKNAYSDYFESLDPCTESMVKSAKYHHFSYLPKITPNNERLIYWMMKLPSEDCFDHTSVLRYCTIIFETQLQFDTVDSTIALFDISGHSMSLALKYDLLTLTKVMTTFYETFSGRFSALHIFNVSPASEILVNLLKSLIPKKVQERVFLHKNAESLRKHFPLDCLPNEVGGTLGISAEELAMKTAKSIQEQREFIMKRNKLGTNEKLRVGRPNIQVDLYGADGTFKKINLD